MSIYRVLRLLCQFGSNEFNLTFVQQKCELYISDIFRTRLILYEQKLPHIYKEQEAQIVDEVKGI